MYIIGTDDVHQNDDVIILNYIGKFLSSIVLKEVTHRG